MYRRVSNKLKPILFLLSMVFVSMFIIFVVNFSKSDKETIDLKSLSSKNQEFDEIISLEELLPNEEILKTYEIKELENTIMKIAEETSKNNSEVLSAINSSVQCKNDNIMEIKTESICYRDSEVDVPFYGEYGAKDKGGFNISFDTPLKLIRVTIPLELYSGVEVKDSNRLIKKDSYTLKPAGEQIDEELANSMLPPNNNIYEYKGIKEDVPFKTDYFLKFSDTDAKSADGDIALEKELGNKCEDKKYNNISNVNPQKSNVISEFLQDSFYRAPNEKEETLERIDECQSADFIDWDWKEGEIPYEACRIDVFTQSVERLKYIFGWGTEESSIVNQIKVILNFFKCYFFSEGNPECISTDDIVLMMSSPFGSDEDCASESACTNTFMDTRNMVVSIPSTDLGKKKYYLTDCQVEIEGTLIQATVRCAWDMSHLYKERKVNEYDDIPTVDATPTDVEYNKFLLEKVKGTRGVDRDIGP